MVLHLYVDPISQPARSLQLFVRANQIPVEEHFLDLLKGEQKTEEFAKVNRFQKVPAIIHDGFQLSESVAILRYLVRAFPVANHWYPKESQSQALARVDEFMAWLQMELRAPTTRYVLALVKTDILIGYGGTTVPATAHDIAVYQKGMERAMDKMENIWLAGGSRFLHGDQLSISDLLAIGEIEMTRLVSYDVGVGRPKLAAYLANVRAELEPHWTEVHAPLLKAQEHLKSIISQ